jgi:hypothetical protein
MTPLNERSGPDLPRGRGRSINGDLDVGGEGSEQTIVTLQSIPLNERLGPDLPRGRGKSIGVDLDVDDEVSKQNFQPLQSLHHYSIVYQSVRHMN